MIVTLIPKAYWLMVLFFATAAVGQTAPFDVLHYKAMVEPDMTNRSVRGKVQISFISLTNNLTEISLNAGALVAESVREGKTELKFEKTDNLLHITLARPARVNEERLIEIEYHGTPRYGLQFYPEQNQIYTVFSTSQWMPCIDAPSDRATFGLTLILPKDLKVTANGRLLRQIDLPGNKVSSEWVQDIPVPSYVFGFAAGNFRQIERPHRGVKLRFLASPQISDKDLLQIFRDTEDMLDFFQDKAGVRYPDKVYTQILAAGGAQQEVSSFSLLNEEYGRGVLENEREDWLAAHELSHQWWGNMITNRDWTHFWLNEGMATFMAAAYKEHRFGREEYLSEIGKLHARYERVLAAGKDNSLVFPDWNNPTREDRSIVYNKGGYILHLLREELGEEKFWKGVKSYTRKNWGKSVTTLDFQKAMENSSHEDLSAFFDKWVY